MRNQRGVTLTELLTVMVIVGVLTGIAIPTYTTYTQKTKRADAKLALMNTAQVLERCYTRTNAYNDANCSVTLPQASPNGAYSIAADAGAGGIAAQTYALKATPIGAQLKDTH